MPKRTVVLGSRTDLLPGDVVLKTPLYQVSNIHVEREVPSTPIPEEVGSVIRICSKYDSTGKLYQRRGTVFWDVTGSEKQLTTGEVQVRADENGFEVLS